MEYFKILNLNREPFSNSPEPDFFFPSRGHLACLQQLELAIRLRRGLNVVLGNVGTGKTTLCRELILNFSEREEDRNEIETHLLLDPSFSTPREFLSAVALSFGLAVEDDESDWQCKENIKNLLFHKGVEEKKIVVLIIDEGQKLPDFCREILREFLNYETNENKLLQIVIFAQKEFREILKDHVNFADRVNQYCLLEPLNYHEMKDMIRFRLARAGKPADAKLFTLFGLWAIYRATGGYPRRIITLCHQILLTLIIQNKVKADWFLVRSVSQRLSPELIRRGRRAAVTGLTAVLFLAFIMSLVLAKQIAAPPDPAKDLPAKTVSVPKVPDNLGQLKIETGGTVIHLLRDIYGRTGTDRFRAVIEANPHIKDINRVRTGELIAFPAVPAAATPWPQNGKLVRIAYKGSLDEAYGFVKKNAFIKKNPSSIRMLPFWNPREGIVFALVLRTAFYDEAEARKAIRNLPPALAATAEIMEKPGGDTVFFAN